MTHRQDCCPDSVSTGLTFLPAPLHNAFLWPHTMVLFFAVWAFGTRTGVSGRAMILGSVSQLWVAKLRISSLLWLGCWDTEGDIASGSPASCLGSNPEQEIPPWMMSFLAGKMGVFVSWQGALWSVHESRYIWIYSLSLDVVYLWIIFSFCCLFFSPAFSTISSPLLPAS